MGKRKILSLSAIEPATYRRAMYHFNHSETAKEHPGQRPSDTDLGMYADWRETHMTPNYKFDTFVRDLKDWNKVCSACSDKSDQVKSGEITYVKSHPGGRKRKE